MAFGKDPSQIQNMPPHGGSYLQRAKTAARRPNRSPKGSSFYWKDCYSPPDLSIDVGRLIAGSYQQEVTYDGENAVTETFPYYLYREHHNGKRGAICAGGALWANKEKAEPCPACDVFWEDVNERKAKKARGDNTKGPNRMSCRDQYVFNWWDYGTYFEMPEVDKNGQFRMNPKTNQPYTHWVKGSPSDPRFQGRPWKSGHLLPWPMGTTYKDTLFTFAVQIGRGCKSCGSKDSIRCVMKICGNPQCGQFIYDPNNCSLTDEQRDQIDNYPYECPHCGQKVFVDEVIECSSCQNPQRASIFDVDLQVQRMGTKGQQTFLQILNWSEPRPIQVSDPEILKTIQPLDLPKKFAPTPPEAQVKIFGLSTSVPTSGPGAPPIVGQPQQQPPMQATPPMQPPMPQQAPQGPMPGPSLGTAPPMQPPPQQQQWQAPMPPMQPQHQHQPQQQWQQPPMQPPQQQQWQQSQPQPQPQPVEQAPVMNYPPMQAPGGNQGQQ